MPMEYRVRVKIDRFDNPIERFITGDEEAAWEFAARESQPMNGEGFIEREIVFIEKQYVSGWQPIGLAEDTKRHYMTQMIPGDQMKRLSVPREVALSYVYGKALAQAKDDHPEIDWNAADVKITLEVTE